MISQIVNIKHQKYDIYIGRTNKTYNLQESKWQNPYIIGKDGDRELVIQKYRLYINSKPELLKSLYELKGKILGCWCYPEPCHGEILIELSNSKYIKNWFSNMLPFEKPLTYQNINYLTIENFYQAMKLPKDRIDLRKEIAEMSQYESKKQIRNKDKFILDSKWNKDKSLKVMEYACKWKFQANTHWYNKLKLTKELGLEIIEWNNWNDKFWGKSIIDNIGENNLGKILMKIRDNI